MATIRVTLLTDAEQKALKEPTDLYNATPVGDPPTLPTPITKTEWAELQFTSVMDRWVDQAAETSISAVREAYRKADAATKAQVATLLGL